MFSIRRHRSYLLLAASLFLFVALSTSNLYAEDHPIKGRPVLPGEDCQMPSQESWSPQEKWVWKQVCEGKIADLNKAEGYGGPFDPKEDKDWPEGRILSPAFLETTLLHEPYRGALTRHGVHIVGAWFKEPLDLSNAPLSHQLWLDTCRFESDVDFHSLQAPRLLSLEGSIFKGSVNLARAEFMEGVNMIRTTFSGKLNMNSMHVEGSLLMHEGAKFAEVDLGGAKIGGLLYMRGARFACTLNMDSVQVGSGLFMDEKAEFANVDLRSAKIGGLLSMRGARFAGTLNMDSVQVGSGLFMDEKAEFAEEIYLVSAEIRGDLDMSDSRFRSLDLTGTRIHREFRLGSEMQPAATWQEGSKLILRNTEVGTLQGSPNAWPDKLELELDGFTYVRLGGFASDGANDMATREISWFEKWLEKDKSYSPQPYEQLASVLRKEGHMGLADNVLYAGRDRELSETKGLLSWLGLFLLNVFIGYGYRIYYAIFWFLGFIALGVLVLRLSGQGPAHGMPYGIAYSLDMLLPIIRLREHHYDFDLAGWARYYFYAHILMGYVLGSFLVAGLSGLAK